jgi:Lantibiotic dehydratase, N terminus
MMMNAVEFRTAHIRWPGFAARSPRRGPPPTAPLPGEPPVTCRASSTAAQYCGPPVGTLSASDLPARRAAWPEWTQAWSSQRRRYRIPDAVHLGEHDVHIRLDLNEPTHLALLRIHLDRTGTATVTEAPDLHATDGTARTPTNSSSH